MTAPWAPKDPSKTFAVLMRYFEPAAESQALLRAFFAERHDDRSAAQFWIGVYQMIVETRG
jgi:hypothetical protein